MHAAGEIAVTYVFCLDCVSVNVWLILIEWIVLTRISQKYLKFSLSHVKYTSIESGSIVRPLPTVLEVTLI